MSFSLAPHIKTTTYTPFMIRLLIGSVFLFTSWLFSPSVLAQSAPGGVSLNLNYWLKADAGVSLTQGNVSAWGNQAVSAGVIEQSASSRQPSFTSNALNFNPGISFNTGNNGFNFLSTDDPAWSSDTVILVFNPSQSLGSNVALQVVLAYDIPMNDIGDAGIGIGSFTNSSSLNFFNSADGTPNSGGEYIASARVSPNTTNDSVLAVVRQDTLENPMQSQLRFWGADAVSSISNLDQFAGHQGVEFTIGRRDGGGLNYDGDVLEVISYSARLENEPLKRIESYLAIKYGLTLNQTVRQDYVNSSGISIYDADGTLSSYVSNIAGIGRDDASGLNQKQSNSSTTNSVQANNNGIVTIGLGTIASTNALNPNTFSNDQQFLIWGNNAESLAFNNQLIFNSIPINHMSRIWAVQESGNTETQTIGTIRLSVPKSIFNSQSTPSIIVSDNPTFEASDQLISLQDDGNNYITTLDLRNGDFFTFAQTPVLDNSIFHVVPLPNGSSVIFGL